MRCMTTYTFDIDLLNGTAEVLDDQLEVVDTIYFDELLTKYEIRVRKHIERVMRAVHKTNKKQLDFTS